MFPHRRAFLPFAWENLRRAPLVPVAIAVTIGLMLDRYLEPDRRLWWSFAILSAIGFFLDRRYGGAMLTRPLIGVWLIALAGLHHQEAHRLPMRSTLAPMLMNGPRIVQVRGQLDESPVISHLPERPELIALPRTPSSHALVTAIEIRSGDQWIAATGRIRVTVYAVWDDAQVGDICEMTGTLQAPIAPLNPGERDPRILMGDDGIVGELRVKSLDDLVRIHETTTPTLSGTLGVIRERVRSILQSHLPAQDQPLARALLLGDNTAMSPADWERYSRTGVIHVLAISGQHLVILAWFLSLVLTLLGYGPRWRAILIGSFLLGYALLTGARPSAMRAAVIVLTWMGGVLVRREGVPINAFAWCWLMIIAMDPSDIFTPGCQLSFLAVAMLVGGLPRLIHRPEPTPLEQAIDESRSWPETIVRTGIRLIRDTYLANFLIFLAVAPIIAGWTMMFSPVSLLLGPPLVLTTSIALIAGFLLILTGGMLGPISMLLAWTVTLGLRASEWLVRIGEQIPGGFSYIPPPPMIGVIATILALLACLIWPANPHLREMARRRVLPVVITLGAMLAVIGLHRGTQIVDRDELRITALAIGHGTATVLELPDGRVLMFDIGALRGPELTRYTVAPYLWQRGISRLDAVMISHADLDHFNGLLTLLDRFRVEVVMLSPTFAQKQSPGVQLVLAELERRHQRIQPLSAGETITYANLSMTVRHPPTEGVSGDANANSLVIELRHQGNRVLLTGDLSGPGLSRVLTQKIGPVDVLMAPHHGSATANTPELLKWARPRMVISSQGSPRGNREPGEVYTTAGIPYWRTDDRGAITLRSNRTGLVAEAFRSGEVRVIRAAGSRKSD